MNFKKTFELTEEEANMISLHNYINTNKWQSEEFIEIFNNHLDGLYKEHELNSIQEAFNLQALGVFPINIIKDKIDDKNKLSNPHIKTLEGVKKLFALSEKNNKAFCEQMGYVYKMDDDDIQFQADIIEYIHNHISNLRNTRAWWKAIQKKNAIEVLTKASIKKYRHQSIFTAFNKIIKETSLIYK